jgi:hypothetical protein
MKIVLDFDGTVVSYNYPNIGQDIGAVPVLKKLIAAGHKLILNTMRCGKELEAAVNWFKEHDIPLYGINTDPEQARWTKSPKAFANLYIDDAALGCPLIYPVKGFLPGEDKSGKPYVDWVKVDEMFENNEFYHSPDPELKDKK